MGLAEKRPYTPAGSAEVPEQFGDPAWEPHPANDLYAYLASRRKPASRPDAGFFRHFNIGPGTKSQTVLPLLLILFLIALLLLILRVISHIMDRHATSEVCHERSRQNGSSHSSRRDADGASSHGQGGAFIARRRSCFPSAGQERVQAARAGAGQARQGRRLRHAAPTRARRRPVARGNPALRLGAQAQGTGR